MNELKLSICIPTFNRVAYLREILPALIREVNRLNSVEIIVVDNASTDDTQEFCQSLHCRFLTYYRNWKNIGPDRNFLECIRRAKGEYVWLFGDDDLILDGGVLKAMISLIEDNPSLLVLNGKEDRVYSDYAECLRKETEKQIDFPLSHTLITANVFRKDIFDLDLAESMINTNYAHMYGYIACLRKGGKVAVLSGVIGVRDVRADFEHWPFALCIKQAVYILRLAKWFGVPSLRKRAFRIALGLPVELAACAYRFMGRLA